MALAQPDRRSTVQPGDGTDPVSGRWPILLLISSLERGGAERQVVQLANDLDGGRFEVHVGSLSRHVPLADGLLRPDRLHIIEKTWRFDWRLVGRVAHLMRRLDIQLVHSFLFDAEMAGRLAARRAGVRAVVASERNTDYRMPLSHRIGQRVTRSRVDALIANSASGKRFIVRTLGIPDHRVHVIRNGVDTARFRPGAADVARRRLGVEGEGPVVGMVATFKRQKNHQHFFEMARRIRARLPAARFVCIGEPLRGNLQGAGDYHGEMQRLVDDLGLRDGCLFPGSRDDLDQLYSAFDVLVLPSAREGVPNVLLEAMACGVPVVATDVADNAVVVPHDRVGYIVPLGDIDALTARVQGLLDDPAQRARMGAAGRQWVQDEFSIARCTGQTAAVYRGLLERAQPGGS